MAEKTVFCYACSRDWQMPLREDCLLCEPPRGDGAGNLKKEYSGVKITIDGKTFTPPDVKCVRCYDSKKENFIVYDEEKLKSGIGCGDPRSFLGQMDVPCRFCMKEEHDMEVIKKTREFGGVGYEYFKRRGKWKLF
jgi:hypothetical protein